MNLDARPDQESPPAGAGRAPAASGAANSARAGERRWRWALLAICAVALAVRLIYLFGWQAVDEIEGDAYYYHAAANLLADGEGFVHPYAWDEGVRAPGADHPPGYSTVLAAFSLVGLDTIRSHQVVTCLIGTATVAFIGLLGRRLAGRRVGLLAAGVAALYPNLWLNDPSLMSESLALLAGVGVIFALYRAWDRPSPARFAVAGAALGLASLVRAEALMLLALAILPLAVWVPSLSGWRPRLSRLALTGGVTALVLAPWVIPNLLRFEHPATLSTQLGPTLEVANCDPTYHGEFLGGWTFACASEVESHDRSELDRVTRRSALEYMSEHRGRLPVVLAARFGRAWGLYAPLQQLKMDAFTDARPIAAARAGLGMYYVLAVAAVGGVVVLRRRGVPSFPLTAWVVNVAITVLVFYGTTRFRAPAEPALVVLAAVGVDGLLAGSRRGREPSDASATRSGEAAAAG